MTYKKLKNPSAGEGEDDWLVTYSDAVTLVLCFFVLLISISEPNVAKFEQIKEQFSEETKDKAKPFEELSEEMQAMISEKMLDETISVEQTERGIVVEISSSSFFESGQAKFKPHAVPILLDIAAILEDFDYDDYQIEVEGHTDDVPLNGGGQFPSNWELSGARASGVVRFFIDEGLERERMRAKAYADILPKVPNIDEEGNPIEANREINRRIAIKIERN